MPDNTTFGDYIREERSRADLGLREAARLMGISASYLSRLEAGDFPPPSGTVLLRLAQVYRSDIKNLMDQAKTREHEMMAADSGVAPIVQAFYRLAHDQSPEMQKKMLDGAIAALDLTDDQKEKLRDQLRAALSRSGGPALPRRASGDDGLFAFDIAPRVLYRRDVQQLARLVLRKVFGAEIPIPVPLETVIRKFDRDIVLIVHDEIEGGRFRDGSPAVLGLSRWSRDGRRRELVIHADLFEAEDDAGRRRANFTIAHELFHCLEHLPLVQQRHPAVAMARQVAFVTLAPDMMRQPWFKRKRERRKLHTREDWREWQANEFAAELLMPAESVREAFEELFGLPRLVDEHGHLEEFADNTARTTAIDDFGGVTSLCKRYDVNPQAMAIRLIALGLVSSE